MPQFEDLSCQKTDHRVGVPEAHLKTKEHSQVHRSLLNAAPKLRELSLCFDRDILSGVVFKNSLSHVDISQITHLTLVQILIHALALVDTIFALMSIKCLRLEIVDLIKGRFSQEAMIASFLSMANAASSIKIRPHSLRVRS